MKKWSYDNEIIQSFKFFHNENNDTWKITLSWKILLHGETDQYVLDQIRKMLKKYQKIMIDLRIDGFVFHKMKIIWWINSDLMQRWESMDLIYMKYEQLKL